MFSPDDIEARKAIWLALSELFLDTDVSLSYEHVARQCAASLYSQQELGQILFEEVMPVCGWNLLSVAGAWSRFDEQWLVEQILDRRKPLRRKINQWIFRHLIRGDIDHHWQAILPMIRTARTK